MGIIWTPTKIDQATFCLMQFYLINIKKIKPKTSGRMALGVFLHRAMEKFYTERKGVVCPKFKSPESFANAMGAMWARFVVGTGKIKGQEISWSSKEEPWILREDLKKICSKVYERYASEHPPIYTEIVFDFELDKRRFRGRIDEIRKKEGYAVIRDLKSGSRKPGKMKLDYDQQFTVYFLAVGCLCREDQEFAESIGISKEDAERFAGNPDYLNDKIRGEYYFMREDQIFDMRRDNLKYFDFCRMINGLEKQIFKGDIYPERGRLCDYCSVHEECDKRSAGILYSPEKKLETQLRFFSQIPSIENKVILPAERQLKIFKPFKRMKKS